MKLCIDRSQGFLLPERWGNAYITDTHIDFWAELAGTRAFIRFDGEDWHIIQDSGFTPTQNSLTVTTSYFAEGPLGLINISHPELGTLPLTSGKVIWQNALAAVILEANEVVAYRLEIRPKD